MNKNIKEIVFENKDTIGQNIFALIKEQGYTKASFSKLTNISRPTLNKILDGQITSITTLDTHISKILSALNISVDKLLNYNSQKKTTKKLDVVYHNNAPENYVISTRASETLNILDNILDLCEIYYK